MGNHILLHSVLGSLNLSVKLILIIVPLMISYEFLENSKIFKKILNFLYLFIKPMGFSKNASISMLTGIFLGITYGSGILIAQSSKNRITKLDAALTAIFLSMCHAVIEDTLIFVAIGGNGAYMLITRIIIATLITYILYKYMSSKISQR